MRNKYRVTKYDPAFRDTDGSYRKSEWTSYFDVGKTFDGVRLTKANYLKTEDSYLFAIESFLNESAINSLRLIGLENPSETTLPPFVLPNASLSIVQCVEFARIVLREVVWGKLVAPGRAYVHFGYDFYMYIGVPSCCTKSIQASESRPIC
jgi:hypothetical protein